MADNIDMVALAERLATEAHAGQFRRDGVTPYITHPAAVVARMRVQEATEAELAAAWLHDVVEDTKVTAQDLLNAGISQEVLDIVAFLTHRDGVSYDTYIQSMINAANAGNEAALSATGVKIGDILTNLSDTPSYHQLKKYSRALFMLTHL